MKRNIQNNSASLQADGNSLTESTFKQFSASTMMIVLSDPRKPRRYTGSAV